MNAVAEKVDLLKNDLFLINETEDEVFNALKGCYARISYHEGKLPNPDKEIISKARKRGMEVAEQKTKMYSADIDTKKSTIEELEAELKTAIETEKKYW